MANGKASNAHKTIQLPRGGLQLFIAKANLIGSISVKWESAFRSNQMTQFGSRGRDTNGTSEWNCCLHILQSFRMDSLPVSRSRVCL